MQSRPPLPSNFELLIDELLARDHGPPDAPKPNRFSIGSLEAAWSLTANSRKKIDQNVARRHPYDRDVDADNVAPSLLDPNKILSELGLDANSSEADVLTLRREFALRNHPDRVRPDLRAIATERMMIANDLMDRYVARLRNGSR